MVTEARIPEGDIKLESTANWQLKREFFSAQKYTLLFLVSMPVGDDGVNSLYGEGFGIVLAEIDGSVDKFSRIGYFRLDKKHKIEFETWMQAWESKTVAII